MKKNVDDILVRFFKKRRKYSEILMDDLALMSGISQGHISRIETGESKLTINMCVQLAYGLGVEFRELTYILGVPALYPEQFSSDACIDVSDIKAFLRYYENERQEAIGVLEAYYDKVERTLLKMKGDFASYPSQDIEEVIWRATEAGPVEWAPLPYPPSLNANQLVEIFMSGAAMTFQDVGIFIKKRRAQRRLSLRNMAEKIDISYVAITRFEQGRLRRSFPSTLIGMGQELNSLDAFWGMVWAASEYDTGILFQRGVDDAFYPFSNLQKKLTDTLIKVFRWVYSLAPEDSSWIDELRWIMDEYYP